MTVNEYLNSYEHVETQNLIEELTIEAIQAKGTDVYYIPRTLVDPDELFGEDLESVFTDFKVIEMYMLNFENFGGDGDLMSKFGLQLKNTAEFCVSRSRFSSEVDIDRPLEGDLIYWPLTKALLQIDYVDFYNPFYQAGKLYTYRIKTSLFEYSHQDMATGVPEIDSLGTTFTAGLADPGQDVFDNSQAIADFSAPFKDQTEENPFGDF